MRTANELAQFLGATISGDASVHVAGVGKPETASATDVIYMDSPRYREGVMKSPALCVLAAEGTELAGKTTLETKNPKLAFARAASWLMPKPALRAEIPPTAILAASAKLARG